MFLKQAIFTGIIQTNYWIPSEAVFKSSITSSPETSENLMYSVNVYSNKEQGKKAECKEIFNVVDNAFMSIGFNRIMKNPIPNKDASIYRITGRYEGIVAEGQQIGADTIYQVYGR